MGVLLKLTSAVFVIITVLSCYSIVQTAANFSMAMETNATVTMHVGNLTVEPTRTSAFVNITFVVSNPSHQDISVNYVEYTIYLYNKSKTGYIKPQEAVDGNAKYDLIIIKAGTVGQLRYSHNASSKADSIKYILAHDSHARVDFNTRIIYKLYNFPYWESKTLPAVTYQETSSYG